MTVTLTQQQEDKARALVLLIDAHDVRAEEREELGRDIPEHEAADAADEQAARVIGTQLNAEGGFALMQAVGRRTAELSDAPRYLDFWWDGIGEWQA